MSLRLHHSETADGLVRALADVLRAPLSDALTTEVIAVPSRGIERWLQQELSQLIVPEVPGITANMAFPSPGRLVDDVLASVGHRESPWSRDRLTWSVLSVLDQVIAEPWMTVPSWFVSAGGTGSAPGRRTSAASKIARLFHRYDLEAPDMVEAWGAGSDIGPDGNELRPSHRWQPQFWRCVRTHLGVPSLAQRLDGLVETIRSDPGQIPLPDRVSIYGLTALPTGQLRVLEALAHHREVNLLVLHPSRSLWDRTADLEEGLEIEPENQLLASWGRDVVELQRSLAQFDIAETVAHPTPVPETDSILGALQRDIRGDRRAGTDRVAIVGNDRSIQIHACHGAARQAAVARDAILHALADDPTLEPRDIVIMCPDIEVYAPLLEAAFHPDDATVRGIPDVRIRATDRAPASDNSVTLLALELVDFARSSASATRVIELLSHMPVRAKFQLDDDRVAQMVSLIDEAGASWGFDIDHRTLHGLANRPERTWDDAMKRVLAGVFFSDRAIGPIEGVMPVPGIEGGELEDAGRLVELIGRLDWVTGIMAVPHPASEWVDLVMAAVDLIGAVDWDTAWQRDALRDSLAEMFEGSARFGDPMLDIGEVAALLEPLTRGRASSVNHRSGDLTACTLVPMRSVPHRVICLVGMDDDRFPRAPAVDGDDVVALNPVLGSRQPAREDRQLLLDAVVAASDQLIITYSGHDLRSNAPLPPATPIAELLDQIDAMAITEEGGRASAAVLVEHPLQPFDPRNFAEGAIWGDRSWGFDPHMLAGANAMAEPSPMVVDAQDADGWIPPDELGLRELRAFLEHPVRAYLSTRIGVRSRDPADPRDDRLALELNHLDQWEIGRDILAGELAGLDRSALVEAMRSGDRLPPGRLSEPAIANVLGEVDVLLEAVRVSEVDHSAATETRRIDVEVAGHPRLTGVVGRIAGDSVSAVHYAKFKPKYQLSLYLDLLVLAATHPEIRWRASLISRGNRRVPQETYLRAGGNTASERRVWAEERIAVLLDLFVRGMAEPLPLFEKVSHAVATGDQRGAASTWAGFRYGGEGDDRHHVQAFGRLSADELFAIRPSVVEVGEGWVTSSQRVDVLAHRLWDPVLALIEESRSD